MAKKDKPTWKDIVKPEKETVFKGFKRLPTGIFELDLALGGGFPIGVTSNLFGVDHSFKTGILLKLISTAQHWCWKCNTYEWECECDEPVKKDILMIDTELIDWDWAERLGVIIDDERLYMETPAYGEEAIDIMHEALKDPNCGLLLIDSISRLLPKKEIDANAGDYPVGERAKLQTQMINKIKSSLILRKKARQPIAVIGTTQIRAKIGGAQTFYGEPIESSAPYALLHDWHLAMKTAKLSPESGEIDSKSGTPYQGRFKATIASLKTKRKMFVLAGSATFKVSLDSITGFPAGTILDHNTFYKYARAYCFKEGKGYNIGGVEFPRKKDLMEFISDTSNQKEYLSLKKYLVDYMVEMVRQGMSAVEVIQAKPNKEEKKEEDNKDAESDM